MRSPSTNVGSLSNNASIRLNGHSDERFNLWRPGHISLDEKCVTSTRFDHPHGLLDLGHPARRNVVGIAEMLSRWKVPRVRLETNDFQSLLTDNLRQAIAVEQQRMDWPITILPVRNTKAKHMRILGMEPLIANKWMWFSDRLPIQFYQQFAEFRPLPDAGKDDAPDAMESAIRVLRGQLDRHGAY